LIKESDAVIWRGPMLARALQQFIEEIEWGALDYLVVDLPPGTGDVQLSLTQLIPLTGAVIVTTPQDVAFADVRRAVRMFEATKTPLLGILENMSHYVCSETGKHHYIFGMGRTGEKASELGVPFLGSLPIDERISPRADKGEPIVIAEPESEVAAKYREIARLTAARQSVLAAG
ncbi:MAG: P-loop NTPase, partial [Deltaproteobacteria bacterium]|nr:P-loop NTPase [Deltaproteobacteria bacterium]